MENLLNNDDNKISINQILECDTSSNTYSDPIDIEETINIDSNKPETEAIFEPNVDPQDINDIDSTQNNDRSSIESDSSAEIIENQTASTTNCLALTIKEEHKLVAVKNVFFHSLKVTWKVIASTIALHLLKLFF